ncbi:MAG: hypothetical protein ACKOUQ_11520 [Aquirufa sp.]
MKKLLFLLLMTPFVLPAQASYPRVAGHVGIVHPLVAFSSDGTETNFGTSYRVGFPMAINVWKTDKVGFSLEVIPTIKAENGSSKVYNVTFHPGILYRLSPDLTFVGRAAFETSGRYGLTPVFNQILKRYKNSNLYLAVPLPIRFGNDKPASIGANIQFGVSF